MSSKHSSRLARIFPCFHRDAGQPLPSSPNSDEHHRPPASEVPSSAPKEMRSKATTRPARHMSTKQQAEAYIPTWQRLDVPDKPSAATGRRKAASVSNGSGLDFSSSSSSSTSSESLESRRRHKRSQSEEAGMLYFGDGTAPPARRMFNAPPPAQGGGTQASSSLPARSGGGILAGRDASGYTATGLTSSSVMGGTYSSLTYGGSLQFNYAQNQSFGAGTGI